MSSSGFPATARSGTVIPCRQRSSIVAPAPGDSAAERLDVETASAGVPDSSTPEPGVVGRHRPSTETAVLHVVRVALDETWSPRVAADRLLERVDGDLAVLRRARARVLRGASERPGGITERALVTLDLALRAGRLP